MGKDNVVDFEDFKLMRYVDQRADLFRLIGGKK